MSTASTKADTVIRNANVITMDRNRPRAQAVAMSDGRIVGVGSNRDVETFIGPGVKVMDMTGKTVLPGFIDAHIHVLNSGIRHVMAADCDLPSISAIQTALRDRAETTPPGQWVQGFKFDDTKTAENRFLFVEDLDAVSTFHPIFVAHRAGHIYYLNSMALELAGFDRDTPDPFGGRLGRDPDTGELNGVVYERAIEHVRFQLIPVGHAGDSPGRAAHHLPDADGGRPHQRPRRAGGQGRVRHLPGGEGRRGSVPACLCADVLPAFPVAAGGRTEERLRRRYAAAGRHQDGGRRGHRGADRLPVGTIHPYK